VVAQVRGISIFREHSVFKWAHTAVDTAYNTRRVRVGKGVQADFCVVLWIGGVGGHLETVIVQVDWKCVVFGGGVYPDKGAIDYRNF